jgi:hypothetical protein
MNETEKEGRKRGKGGGEGEKGEKELIFQILFIFFLHSFSRVAQKALASSVTRYVHKEKGLIQAETYTKLFFGQSNLSAVPISEFEVFYIFFFLETLFIYYVHMT